MSTLLKIAVLFALIAGGIFMKNEIIADRVAEKLDQKEVKYSSVICSGVIQTDCKVNDFSISEDGEKIISAESLSVTDVINLDKVVKGEDVKGDFHISLNSLKLEDETKEGLKEILDGRQIEPISLSIDFQTESNSSLIDFKIDPIEVDTALFKTQLSSSLKVVAPKSDKPSLFVENLTVTTSDVRKDGKSLLFRDSDIEALKEYEATSSIEKELKGELLKFYKGEKEKLQISIINREPDVSVDLIATQLYMMFMFNQLQKVDKILEIRVEAK